MDVIGDCGMATLEGIALCKASGTFLAWDRSWSRCWKVGKILLRIRISLSGCFPRRCHDLHALRDLVWLWLFLRTLRHCRGVAIHAALVGAPRPFF